MYQTVTKVERNLQKNQRRQKEKQDMGKEIFLHVGLSQVLNALYSACNLNKLVLSEKTLTNYLEENIY